MPYCDANAAVIQVTADSSKRLYDLSMPSLRPLSKSLALAAGLFALAAPKPASAAMSQNDMFMLVMCMIYDRQHAAQATTGYTTPVASQNFLGSSYDDGTLASLLRKPSPVGSTSYPTGLLAGVLYHQASENGIVAAASMYSSAAQGIEDYNGYNDSPPHYDPTMLRRTKGGLRLGETLRYCGATPWKISKSGADPKSGLSYIAVAFADGSAFTGYFRDAAYAKPFGYVAQSAPLASTLLGQKAYLVRMRQVALGNAGAVSDSALILRRADGTNGLVLEATRFANGASEATLTEVTPSTITVDREASRGSEHVVVAARATSTNVRFAATNALGIRTDLNVQSNGAGSLRVAKGGFGLLATAWNAKGAGSARFNGRLRSFSSLAAFLALKTPIATASVFKGTWSGGWVAEFTNDGGGLAFGTDANGALSGLLSSQYDSHNRTVSGTIDNTGWATIQYRNRYGKWIAFQGYANLADAAGTKVSGELTVYVGDDEADDVTIRLTRP